MIKCKKTYYDVPFAHRQHKHDGHCSYIHGHNWDITVHFTCDKLDENGFVVDFGKLKFLKEWIDKNLDHACVFGKDDDLREKLFNAAPCAWKIYIVDSCSCEGMAAHLLPIFDAMLRDHTNGRVWVSALEVSEDKKNSAMIENSK